jgi:Protein of unknown function (DUF2510)
MTEQNSQGTAPAGWYPVAPGSPQLRWWDGTQWTEHHHTVGISPMTPVYGGQALRAPEGTKSGTAWIWIFALLPLVQLAELPFLVNLYSRIFSASLDDPRAVTNIEFSPDSGYLAIQGIGLLSYGVYVVLAVFDHLALKSRGVPRPFHWGWTFLSSLVYIIGRTVVVRRRTGNGTAPLWIYIVSFVVTVVAVIAVIVPILAAAVNAHVPAVG